MREGVEVFFSLSPLSLVFGGGPGFKTRLRNNKQFLFAVAIIIEAHVPHILNQVDDSNLATCEGTTETIFRVPGIKPTT